LNGDFLEHYFTNNSDLKSEFKTIKYKYNDTSFIFTSDNGVFSKEKIDFGSRLLVETYLNNRSDIKTLLDVGCGYGYMGIVLSKILNAKATLIDVNKRAVHLTEKNIKENKVSANTFVSDAYENVQNKFDLIITNPPIRAGKSVVYDILINAKNYLNEFGELWFVIRKEQGAKSAKKDLEKYYKIDVMKKDKGFYIFRAKTIDNNLTN
jgi:16S rRNA (guanine1207-N2)-methyltransferase